MSFRIQRTVASELTLWLSMITMIIAMVFGLFYYFYASNTVTQELITDAKRTADEFSEVLVSPLFNFDQVAALKAADIYLTSGLISGMRIEVDGIGEVFNNLRSVSSSLPTISKSISKNGLQLGSMELVFNDSPVVEAKKRAVWTTLVTVAIILIIYMITLRLILGRILVGPLTGVGTRLREIANGDFEGRMDPVPQKDLNTIVIAANMMSEQIAVRTKMLIVNERNYQEVYNATSDAIFIHDAEDGSIVDVNQTMLDMYGYSRQEAMALQAGDLSRGDPPYSQQDLEILAGKAALKDGPQVFKWQARRKDGSLFWAEVALKKTVIGDQEVFLATVRDISERQRLEEKLRHVQKMEAIGTLAGGIAHDFNNILTAILGYTELALMKADKKSELFEHLQQVEKASKRARDLVRQILTFSRKQQQKKEVVQLASVVGEAVTLLRSIIPATVEIRQNLSSQARVEVDPGQMHQLIINLCTNGCQSMPDSSGILTVSLKDIDVEEPDTAGLLGLEPGSYVVIEVSDNGTGMDEEIINKIFDPYFTTKESDKGTGLGLAVVHGIVKSHNGQVTVNSKPGLGTTFQVFLPVTDAEMEIDNLPASEMELNGNQKVMVVDDDESIRNMLDQVLTFGGYRVDLFEDGSAAWNALSANPTGWDLIITDLTMPNMTGAELARKVAQLRPDMPVILCTGYNEIHSDNRGKDLAVSAYLQKPLTIEELLTTTSRVLHIRDVD